MSSYLTYRDNGVQIRDTWVEIVVLLIMHEIDTTKASDQVVAMVEHWRRQREWAFGIGCVDIGFDKYIDSDMAVRREVMQLLVHARELFAAYGDVVSRDELDRLIGYPSDGYRIVRDIPKPQLVEAVTRLIAILE